MNVGKLQIFVSTIISTFATFYLNELSLYFLNELLPGTSLIGYYFALVLIRDPLCFQIKSQTPRSYKSTLLASIKVLWTIHRGVSPTKNMAVKILFFGIVQHLSSFHGIYS